MLPMNSSRYHLTHYYYFIQSPDLWCKDAQYYILFLFNDLWLRRWCEWWIEQKWCTCDANGVSVISHLHTAPPFYVYFFFAGRWTRIRALTSTSTGVRKILKLPKKISHPETWHAWDCFQRKQTFAPIFEEFNFIFGLKLAKPSHFVRNKISDYVGRIVCYLCLEFAANEIGMETTSKKCRRMRISTTDGDVFGMCAMCACVSVAPLMRKLFVVLLLLDWMKRFEQ